MNYALLREQLERHEGNRKRPYLCSAGKLTVGIGHNLDDNDLPKEIINRLFEIDIQSSLSTCSLLFIHWQKIPDVKQSVLANMGFQLGYSRLKGFKKLIQAVNAEDWKEASRQMLDSKWARDDTPKRANELAAMMAR